MLSLMRRDVWYVDLLGGAVLMRCCVFLTCRLCVLALVTVVFVCRRC